MSAIGPGDFVEAVRAWEAENGLQELIIGNVYRVREFVRPPGRGWIVDTCSMCGDDQAPPVLLHGDDPTDVRMGHCHCSFRPIYRPRANVFDHLLVPAPELEPA